MPGLSVFRENPTLMKTIDFINSSHNGLFIFLFSLFVYHSAQPRPEPPERSSEKGFPAAYSALEATVKVESVFQDGDGFSVAKKGTGSIISPDGFILTNYHNIGKAQHIEITHYNGFKQLAEMTASDPEMDLALLKVGTGRFPHLTLGSSDSLRIGEAVYAIGNPHNLDFSLTSGIVSGFQRKLNVIQHPRPREQFIQTDAPINSGCSGGPLLNAKGELVGVITAIVSNWGHYEGYSFAQPTELVKEFLKKESFEY